MSQRQPGSERMEICLYPYNISSSGIWGKKFENPWKIFSNSLPLLEMQMTVIFLLTQAFHHIFLKHIGIPKFISQIIAGIVLGPQLLGLMKFSRWKLSAYPSVDGNWTLETMSGFGCVMFVFLMAVKTNGAIAFRNGRLPILIGVTSVFFPLILGMSLIGLIPHTDNPHYLERTKLLQERAVVVTLLSLTTLPVVTNLLSELKILNSELGRLSMSSALISDGIGLVIMTAVSFLTTLRESGFKNAILPRLFTICYILVALFVFRPMAEWIVRHTPEGRPVRNVYVVSIFLVVFTSAFITNLFNQFILLGPLLCGLVIPDGPPLGSTLEIKFEGFVQNVFFPLFVTTIVMKADMMKIFFNVEELLPNTFFILLGLTAKLAAALFPCLCFKVPFKDSLALALIMSCRGFMELSLFDIAREKGRITMATYSLAIFYILINSGIVPTIVKSLYDPKRKYIGYQKRNIMHLKPKTELRIVTCLHRSDNVPPVICLLELLSSDRESPLAVDVLHLMKLVGRMFPLLISHQKRTKRVIDDSYFETAMLAFNQFEQNNWGYASVKTFTAFSPQKLMHEDVCTLALDELASLIVLPFHRKWSINGSVEADDETIRNLNCSLLGDAPCSLAILVDRGHVTRPRSLQGKKTAPSMTHLSVGMIFIGGKDDREALTLAKRMAKTTSQNMILDIIRLTNEKETNCTDWEYILDHEVLRELKQSLAEQANVNYVEEVANDGPESAWLIRSLAKNHDLLIVGRRYGVETSQMSGLSEWAELPELGIVGDLLASKDLDTRASVLIVQQQQPL